MAWNRTAASILPALPGRIDALNAWVGRIFSPVLILITLLAVYEVFRRYFLSDPTTWVWEINSQLMCLAGAMAGGYALLRGTHVSVDILAVRLSPRTRAALDLLTAPFFFLFVGCLIWFGTVEAVRAFSSHQRIISQFASPLWPIKAAVPIGGILIGLQGVAKLIRDIRVVRATERS